MNCVHSGQFCAVAYACALNVAEALADACGNYLEDPGNGRSGCGDCSKHGTHACKWECFRAVADRSKRCGYIAAIEHGDGAKVREYIKRMTPLTPYQRAKRDGTLAAQRAATAARMAKIRVDNDADVSLQCAASAIAGGAE